MVLPRFSVFVFLAVLFSAQYSSALPLASPLTTYPSPVPSALPEVLRSPPPVAAIVIDPVPSMMTAEPDESEEPTDALHTVGFGEIEDDELPSLPEVLSSTSPVAASWIDPGPAMVTTEPDESEEPTVAEHTTEFEADDDNDDAIDNADDDVDGDEVEVGPTFAPSNPPESRAVCVEAIYLARLGIDEEHLVHKNHILADVLCPMGSSLPCGTAAHGLIVGGKVISYREWCAKEGARCIARTALVNSVLTVHWRDEVHHHDQHSTVVLTMFDVRYPRLLQKVVHGAIAIRRVLRI